MPDDSTDLTKIANVLAMLLTREMNRSTAAATLSSCGFSTKQISVLIGSSEGSVRALISQARKKSADDKPPKAADG